jgi:hypothetical protein
VEAVIIMDIFGTGWRLSKSGFDSNLLTQQKNRLIDCPCVRIKRHNLYGQAENSEKNLKSQKFFKFNISLTIP